MNRPRPFLTALCFVLFVAVFAATNLEPAAAFFATLAPPYSGDATFGHSRRTGS